MLKLLWQGDSWKEYQSWDNDKANKKKLNSLILDALRTPFSGLGKPEPLGRGAWSRRINKKDRLVYRVDETTLIIMSCRGHYDDH
jgi:toxin YoeB